MIDEFVRTGAFMGTEPLIRNCTFQFRCQQKWAEMTPTLDRRHRFCADCKRQVTLCETDDQLGEALRQNSCVAIPTNLRRERSNVNAGGYTVGELSPRDYGSEGTKTA